MVNASTLTAAAMRGRSPIAGRRCAGFVANDALALALTYDPRYLAAHGVAGVGGDVAKARRWYQRAAELGSPDALRRWRGLLLLNLVEHRLRNTEPGPVRNGCCQVYIAPFWVIGGILQFTEVVE